MKRLCIVAVLLCLSCVKNGSIVTDDADRAWELAAMLDGGPRGFGSTIDERITWDRIGGTAGIAGVVRNAELLMDQPPSPLPDDLFLDFSVTGNRSNYQTPFFRRRTVLASLVIAECVENRGLFLPAIETYIGAICSEKTWVLPAHDPDLDNFNRRNIYIDLSVASTSWYLATADHMLGDRLSNGTRRLIRAEVRRQAFDPFLAPGGRIDRIALPLQALLDQAGETLVVLDVKQTDVFFFRHVALFRPPPRSAPT